MFQTKWTNNKQMVLKFVKHKFAKNTQPVHPNETQLFTIHIEATKYATGYSKETSQFWNRNN
jgi:hypothetical protein